MSTSLNNASSIPTTVAVVSNTTETAVHVTFPTGTPAISSSTAQILPSSTSSPPSLSAIPTSYPTGAPLSRWVAVDDADTDIIEHTGNWVSLVNSTDYDGYGNHGKPYQGTLHALTNGTGSIAFSINSTRGEIMGTTKIANTSGVDFDPKWFCTIDGSRFMPDDPSAQAQNNWPLCEWDSLSVGVHLITLNATSNGQTFFVDQLSYIPAAGAVLTGKSIIVPWSDPKITYDGSWGGYSGSSMMTTTKGATWNFTFEGTSVEWYAMLPAQFVQMRTPSMATYAIDNGTSVSFSTGSLPSGSSTQFNQLQLKTPEVAAGTHTLSVQFLGDATTAPLFLESLIVHNTVAAADLATTATVSSTSTETSPASTLTSTPGSSKRTPTGAIIGGAVGGTALLIIIILTIWSFLHKARKKRQLAEQLLDIDEPLPAVLHPFPLESKDTQATSPYPHSEGSETQSPPYESADGKPPYSITNRRASATPVNVHHRLTLQIQNATLSSSDLTETESDAGQTRNRTEGVVMHKDSGIRLADSPAEAAPRQEPVEYPPEYTPR